MVKNPCDPIDCYEIIEYVVVYAGYEPARDAISVPVAVDLMPDIADECECPNDYATNLYLVHITEYPRPCTRSFRVPIRRRVCEGLQLDPLTCEDAVEALKRGL